MPTRGGRAGSARSLRWQRVKAVKIFALEQEIGICGANSAEMEGFIVVAENLRRIREEIAACAARRQRAASSGPVKLVAVTKNHTVDVMREAIDAGAQAIGENRVQEALGKADALQRAVEWHLIGHLQTNKVRQAVPLFQLIHSVDSERLALEIDRVARRCGKVQDILLQINIASEESKFGVAKEAALPFARFASALENVRLCGLMAIAPHYADAEKTRPLFRGMFELFAELKAMRIPHTDFAWLSMGMSNDYAVAVEEGANLVRVGTGIFGERQY